MTPTTSAIRAYLATAQVPSSPGKQKLLELSERHMRSVRAIKSSQQQASNAKGKAQ